MKFSSSNSNEKGNKIKNFEDFQVKAFHHIEKRNSVVVCAPTGSGILSSPSSNDIHYLHLMISSSSNDIHYLHHNII
jgi:hypothetical protein